MSGNVKKSAWIEPEQEEWLAKNPGVNFSGTVRQVLDYLMGGGSMQTLEELMEEDHDS